jgi:hypothetical protein
MNNTVKYLVLKAALSLVCTAVASDIPVQAARHVRLPVVSAGLADQETFPVHCTVIPVRYGRKELATSSNSKTRVRCEKNARRQG